MRDGVGMSALENIARENAEAVCRALDDARQRLEFLAANPRLSPGLRLDLVEAARLIRSTLCDDARLTHSSWLMCAVDEELKRLEQLEEVAP